MSNRGDGAEHEGVARSTERGDRDANPRSLRTGRRTFLKGSAATIGASAIPAAATGVAGEESSESGAERVDIARSSEGMVSTVHPQATEVGAEVLRDGGNAIDAAVATQFALNVVQPHSSGIGGGGFMVVYIAEEDELYTVDNRERAPLGANAEMFLDDEGEPIPFDERITLGEAVGVPGTLRATDVATKRFGTRYIDELIEPAIELASGERRVTVDEYLAGAIEDEKSKFNDAARERFVPGGEALDAGDELVQEDLAETFRLIRDEGIGALYGGEIGEAVADVVQDNGGSMTVDDLARYNVTIDTPEYGEYENVAVRTQPLPSSGGLTIAQILKLIEAFDLGGYERESAETFHALIEAFHLAYADRGAFMGDKAFADAPWQGLLDEEYLEERRERITFDEATTANAEPGDPWAYQPGNPYRVRAPGEGTEGIDVDATERMAAGDRSTADRGQTTHFTTADSEGNLVSWTTTIEQLFGTGIVVPEYGFFLNNELTDFDAVPGGPNEVAPTKRPLSSTSPTIVFSDGEPVFTVGSPGGTTIITTVAQIIQNVVEYDMDLAEAIAAPRIYADADPTVFYEPDVPADLRERLHELGHELAEEPSELGNVQAILVDRETGEYVGAADYRRNGSVIGL
jgi:gamma-glutamyltranspeptidase/glutathione hydrolase